MVFPFDNSLLHRTACVVPVTGTLTRSSHPVIEAEMPWKKPGIHGRHAVLYDEDYGVFGQKSDEGGSIGLFAKLCVHLHRTTLYGYQIGEDTSVC
jgi:hypothetical protein